MCLPCSFIRFCCLTATSCWATTADTLTANAAAATKTRFIECSSIFLDVDKRRGSTGTTMPTPATSRIFRRYRDQSEAVLALRLADGDPDPFGGRRHINVIDLVFPPQPFDDRVD